VSMDFLACPAGVRSRAEYGRYALTRSNGIFASSPSSLRETTMRLLDAKGTALVYSISS